MLVKVGIVTEWVSEGRASLPVVVPLEVNLQRLTRIELLIELSN